MTGFYVTVALTFTELLGTNSVRKNKKKTLKTTKGHFVR